MQRYRNMPLIEYAQEIRSFLIFMEHKVHEWGQFQKEKKLEIFVGSDHKYLLRLLCSFLLVLESH